LPIAKVNPRKALRFAEAAGVLAKTDRVDAAVLARMGVALEPAATKPRDGQLDVLRELHLARQALVKDRTAAKNRLAVARSALARRLLGLKLAQIDRHIAALEAVIQDHLRTEDGLARRATILTSIPGVSTLTAVAMMVEMPELGTLGASKPPVSPVWPP
jgi:transposase